MSRSLRATAVAALLFCLATCLEWGGVLSAAWPGDLTRYIVIANRTFAGGIPYHNFYDEYRRWRCRPSCFPGRSASATTTSCSSSS